ncbi:MAG: cobyrinate a,c-diamide synthase [Lachnospiraceae bacterium]|nr:cobyrinate a,c-diamide synthase [Lachnospiraceae bacterium]
MNIKQMPRVMIAAMGSHSGKTVVTMGLLQHLLDKQIGVCAFKCGPDYIDPMFHRMIPGVESRNLDTFFSGADEITDILSHTKADYAVIEGVMGIYDGIHVSSLKGSCYEIASITKTPIFLLADAKGCGRTILSQIKGILADDKEHLIGGILFNRMSGNFYEKIAPYMEEELRLGGMSHVKLLGALPPDNEITLESRHLGLVMPDETEKIREKIRCCAKLLEKHCDLHELNSLMRTAPDLLMREPAAAEREDTGDVRAGMKNGRPVLAVAKDEAFCFYYRNNLEQLEKSGVTIRYFSPLHDEAIPTDAAGLLLGGGYPELHLAELAGNTSMISSIRNAIEDGMPSIAECGGFMYLHKSVCDPDGRSFLLVGALDGICRYTGHPVRFGYIGVKCMHDTAAFSEDLTGLKGHEFHYYDSTCNGTDCLVRKPVSGREWDCMFADDTRLWGFPHFYYDRDRQLTDGFVKAMRAYLAKK